MKGFSRCTVYPLCLVVSLWLLVGNPGNALGGPDSKTWPDAAALENMATVEQYDLLPGTETTRATASFSKEEVQRAKDIAFARLKAEGIDGYAPSLRLMDAKQPDKIIVIHVGLFKDMNTVLENGELLGRTYHIQNGKLIRVIKRYPDGRAMATRIEFTNEEIEKAAAAAAAAAHMRDSYGWRDDEFEVRPYRYGKRSESESYLLEFIAAHNDDKSLKRPGGGKSHLVIMNMDALEVVRVLAFQ